MKQSGRVYKIEEDPPSFTALGRSFRTGGEGSRLPQEPFLVRFYDPASTPRVEKAIAAMMTHFETGQTPIEARFMARLSEADAVKQSCIAADRLLDIEAGAPMTSDEEARLAWVYGVTNFRKDDPDAR